MLSSAKRHTGHVVHFGRSFMKIRNKIGPSTDHRHQKYKRKADLFKKKARQAKRLYEKRLAKGVRQNKKAFFRYVNSKLTVRPEITEIQNENGTLIDNEKEITNILGKYFNSVHTPVSGDAMPNM